MTRKEVARFDLLLYHAMEGGLSPDAAEELFDLANKLKRAAGVA